MELYRLDHSFKVIKLEIVKETQKTVVYRYPGDIIANTVRKVEIDKKRHHFFNIVATSLDKLLELTDKLHQDNIEYHKDRIKIEDRNIGLIRKSIESYGKE